MRQCQLHFVSCLTFALSALIPFRAYSTEEPSPLEKEKENLGKLVVLTMKNGKFQINREAWQNVWLSEEEADHFKTWYEGKTEVRLLSRIVGGKNGNFFTKFKENEFSWAKESDQFKASLDNTDSEFGLYVHEKKGVGQTLDISASDDGGFALFLDNPSKKQNIVFGQSPAGIVLLNIGRGNRFVAPTFDALLKQAPDQIQLGFIRPLAEIGIQMPPSPYLPAVMARATSGYSDPPFEIARQVAPAIRQLSLDDADARDAATLELIKLFPLAVKQITDAAASTPDRETELRLRRVIAAHPGISKFKEYVEAEKLQDNKAYLLDLFTNVKFFKESARQRLIAVYGHDYGNDPANWPRP